MRVPADIVTSIATTLQQNQREVSGNLYTVPSHESYPHQWLWDSCFHALIYTYLDPVLAEKELQSLFVHQWSNGMVPHIRYWDSDRTEVRLNWGVENTSSLIQPPLLAYTVWRVYAKTGNREWLEFLYPKLIAWHEYLDRERTLPHRNLYGIINPDESGEDNSPRFDGQLGLPAQHEIITQRDARFALFPIHTQYNYIANQGTHTHFWVEDIPFNVFAIASLEAMHHIAHELGHDAQSRQHKKRAHDIASAMRKHCFVDGSFWSAQGPNKPLIPTNSWARFAPLFVGLYTRAEAAHLVAKQFNDPETFALAYQVPTVAAAEPSFSPDEPTWGAAWEHPDWRGAIWMMSNWCIWHGLNRYGFTREAQKLATQSYTLIEQSGMRENYHPYTGAGQGASGFTWSGLVLDMQS